MKLEFIDDISDGGKYKDVVTDKLVRLFDFDNSQAKKFSEQIKHVILENGETLDLKNMEIVDPVNCNLILRLADTSVGIKPIDKTNFICDLTIADYEDMICRIEPFYSSDQNGYQWLYDLDTPIEFLFSPGGTW